MKQRLMRAFSVIRDEMESWGLPMPRARHGAGQQRVQVVLVEAGRPPVSVGELTQEDGDFVFRYAKSFASSPGAKPISAFPEFDAEYRDRVLFPFFAVRLPPQSRDDVREAMHRLKIPEEDTLRVLGSLAKRAIANPYEFRLVGTPV